MPLSINQKNMRVCQRNISNIHLQIWLIAAKDTINLSFMDKNEFEGEKIRLNETRENIFFHCCNS